MPTTTPLPYQYTAKQSELISLYDFVRTCLLYERYYGEREHSYSRTSTWLQVIAGLGSSATLAALLTVKSPGVWIIITAAAAVVLSFCPSLI
jgi:hypothetical protein